MPASRTFATDMSPRTLFLLLLFPIVLPFQAQPAGSALNHTDEKGRKQGEWAKYWDSGKVRYMGAFENGMPNGLFRHFDEAGVLTSEVLHVGERSRARHFHPEGGLMATGNYIDQRKDSTWNYYDVEGRLRKVEHYSKGELDGAQITYYGSGGMAEKGHFSNGIRKGEFKEWFENGHLKSEYTYVDGRPDGDVLHNHPNGRKESEGRVVNGEREGTWRYFNEDGSLHLQAVFRSGEMVKEKRENGTFTEYWDGEKVKRVESYRNGKREGSFVEYHNNGTWLLKQQAADPVTGASQDLERVLEGQTKSREGSYKNDLLDGAVKEYDERGKLVRTTQYVAGEAVKGK